MAHQTIATGNGGLALSRAWPAALSAACQAARHISGWTRAAGLAARRLAAQREVVIAVHLSLIGAAWYLAFLLRFDGALPGKEWSACVRTLPWILLVHAVLFEVFGLRRGLWRYTGVQDLARILCALGTGTVVAYLLVFNILGLTSFPRSVLLIAGILQVCFVSGVRLALRMWRELRPRRAVKRILIVGAGDAGEMIARDLQRHHYETVGFVDDDPAKLGKCIHGARVLGGRADLPRIVAAAKPQEILLAIPSAGPAVLRDFVHALEQYKTPITTLPPRQELTDDNVAVHHMRRLAIEDLLARAAVGLGVEPLKHLVMGRPMMVTGAGGSIGSELCRQLAALRPSLVVLFERYENGLYALLNDLEAAGYASLARVAVGDVCDPARVSQVMAEYRPAVVFHAAAHKHVPLMELAPCEAVKNNVVGTRTVAAAAMAHQVERFILISTDKAVNPSSMMGATKRVAELVLRAMAGRSSTRFVTVRFGNVLGSNGSVIPHWLKQIEAGGPVTITHPDIRRYFMLIPEAVQLVLHAAAMAEGGETFVLEMGPQVKLVDMARQLIRLSGFVPEEEIRIEFTGLRPGEKLYEELVADGEEAEPSLTPKILRVRSLTACDRESVERNVARLSRLAVLGDVPAVIRVLKELVPTFQHTEVRPDRQAASRRMAIPQVTVRPELATAVVTGHRQRVATP